MVVSIEDGLEEVDSRGRGLVGVLGCFILGSFLVMEIVRVLSFFNWFGLDFMEVKSLVLGEIRREI